jgi:hypothetical protein
MSLQLWIDDLRSPVDFVYGEWHHAKTITEAIRILATQDVSVVSIDFDICHVLPMDEKPPADIKTKTSMLFQPITCPENYSAVAYYIVALPPERRPGKVVIHTANPIGAKTIESILGDKIDVISIRMAGNLPEDIQ